MTEKELYKKQYEEKYGTNDPIKLRDMLLRALGEINYQEPGVVLDSDIKEWYEKQKLWYKEKV